MAATQLDNIEAALRRIELQQQQHTAMLTSITIGAQLMALTIAEVASKIDTATNEIGAKLDQTSMKLDAVGVAIGGVATVVQELRDRLIAAGVPQEVLDQLDAAATKLTGAATDIDAETTKIDSQVTQLQAIAADPANPVPAVR